MRFNRSTRGRGRPIRGRRDALFNDFGMAREYDDYSTSEDESDQVEDLTSGPMDVETNGIGNGSDAETKLKVEPGMLLETKKLYAGKEDKRGRYQWQDTIPKDVGKPVENAKTAKYALLCRYVKVYSDPRKTLALHSILVQSPLLKKLLEGILKDYPGVTVGLRRLEFSGKFEPLIHRWSELREAISKLGDSENDQQTKKHADLLMGVLLEEFTDVIDTSQDLISKGVMTYEYLWTLFQPGSLVYAKHDGQDQALKLSNTKYGVDRNGNPVFWVSGKYVDWDGTRFGTNKLNQMIPRYSGTRKIQQLAAFPLSYHSEKDELTQRLLDRGTKWESLVGSHFKMYHGVGWKRGQFGEKNKYNIKSRIMIDTYGWNRFNPNWAIFLSPLNQKPAASDPDSVDYDGDDYGDDNYDADEPEDGGMPIDGNFLDEDGDETRVPLTKEQKLIATPLIRGYALKNKIWLNMFVNSVQEIEWSDGAFDGLVLPNQTKELILGFTESQRKNKNCFDDIVEGKGRGIILLLCGPPGVGKTLTAESVAEEMRVPLFMMSAGDLGLDPRNIEQSLKDVMEMCTKWNAILLLDEADVFLEQRSLHELERNKIVSIFLRVLEYYEGIMFLTTNRVNTFDLAFQSRIHISLDYPDLSVESRRMIWENFLNASEKVTGETSQAQADGVAPKKHTLTDRQLDQLALANINGRQIKNVLKTAQLLASRKEAPLSYEHVMTVMDVTQHLHNSTQATEQSRAAIFC